MDFLLLRLLVGKSFPKKHSLRSRKCSLRECILEIPTSIAHTVKAHVGCSIAIVAMVVGLAAGSAHAQSSNTIVGATSGTLGVSPSGGAAYAIPVTVPPGTTGVQPKIALQYTSQGGNGAVGVGWSIGGLATITRCATDLYFDDPANGGVGIDSVDYDANDKFCLNGQRLVALNGGTYGADGTEYRTFFEEFSKVVSYGTSGSGPTWFKVWKKNGDIFEFGNTAGSRVVGQNRSDVRAWVVNKILDRRSNFIQFVYSQDVAAGTHRIAQVRYTGNDAQGLVPYNSIDFVYESRSDIITNHHAGDKIVIDKRLKNIKVMASGQLVRDYRIAYDTSGTGRSRVISLTECANATTCFEGTTFNWSESGLIGFNRTPAATNLKIAAGHNAVVSGDFDGDGLTDFYTVHNKPDRRAEGAKTADNIFIAQGNGTFLKSAVAANLKVSADHTVVAIGDFNGDGLTDFYTVHNKADGRADGALSADNVFLATGNGTFAKSAVAANLKVSANHAVVMSGDVNGDNLTDFYTVYNRDDGRADGGQTADNIFISNGDGTFAKSAVAANLKVSALHDVVVSGDYNGDGLTDFYTAYKRTDGRVDGGQTADNVFIAKGDGTFTKNAVAANLKMTALHTVVTAGDFNGDNLTDFYTVHAREDGRADGGQTADTIFIAKGDGTFAKSSVAAGSKVPALHNVVVTGDLNGDGLSDFYSVQNREDGRTDGGQTADTIFVAKRDGTFAKLTVDASRRIAALHNVVTGGNFNGDNFLDIYTVHNNADGLAEGGQTTDEIFLSASAPPDYLTQVTNGHGLESEFIYKPLTDPSVYTKGTGAAYPVSDDINASYVVAQVRSDNGIGGRNSQSYLYKGLRTHRRGLGSLGFAEMEVTDGATGIKDATVYSQKWETQAQGLMKSQRTVAPNGTVLKETTVGWMTNVKCFDRNTPAFRCFRFTPSSTTTTRDLNGALISVIQEDTTYDDFGFPTQLSVSTTNANQTFTKITNNTYTHNAGDWLLGRLTRAAVTHQAPGQSDQVRTSAFTYTADGLVASETIEPGNALFHTKTNAYNGFGAVTSIVETWGSTSDDRLGPTSRTTSFTYDAEVRYRVTETNPLGHRQTNTYDPLIGLKTSSTGPNGLTTSWTYDAFGRATLETRADNTTTATTRRLCNGTCGTFGYYRVEAITTGGGTNAVVFDKLNRKVQSQTFSATENKWIDVDTEYDALGRITRTSEPYFRGATAKYWTTLTYDLLGRPLTTTQPDGGQTFAVYNGLTKTSTNALGQTKTLTNDAAGRLLTVTDTQGNTITNTYNALGQVLSTTSSVGTTSRYAYDIRGNKISDTDPDKGTWLYRYNALGMLVAQANAKNQVTRMYYDVLGRMLNRIDDYFASNRNARTATWVYDQGNKAIGKLTSATRGGYRLTSNYDNLGRPIKSTEQIGTSTYVMDTTYDQFSRLLTLRYPTGFQVRNVYAGDGALIRIEHAVNSLKYWERVSTDARGNVTEFKLANGAQTNRIFDPLTGRPTSVLTTTDQGLTVVQNNSYQFDVLGNLKQRKQLNTNQTETFVYDNLNRVVQVDTTVGGNTTTSTVAYDSKGNITNKSDVGGYTYGQVNTRCSGSNAGPHAVTGIAGIKNTTYCYDANGNMTSGDGRTITYTSYDKPSSIQRSTSRVQFGYGPDRSRFIRVDTTSSGTTTTHYAGGKAFERIARPSGDISDKHYIGDFAVITFIRPVTGNDYVISRYLHRDHLGSIEAITNYQGAIQQRMSFDAWGRRREVNWQALTDTAITTFATFRTTRGFTGHEMLDPVGLVHMNGRVYDPTIGRFLSADPHVQAPNNLQNWNRYSYVLNNPLSYTDPTGFFFKKLFKSIGKAISGAAKAVGNVVKKAVKAVGKAVRKVAGAVGRLARQALSNPIVRSLVQIVGCAITAAPTGGLGCAAISGLLTAATGGSIADAFTAAAFSFAQIGIWTGVGTVLADVGIAIQQGASFAANAGAALAKSAVHGVVGGAISIAQGGNFVQGFAANAIGALGGAFAQGSFGNVGGFEGVLARTSISAVAGCGAATFSGGKCANGAVTAGFAHLFNAERGRVIGRRVGAALRGKAGAEAGGRLFSRLENFLLRLKTTSGLFLSTEGHVRFFTSGGPPAGGLTNYPIALHAEGKAAHFMRQHNLQTGLLIINHRKVCTFCMRQVPTFLPPNAKLFVSVADKITPVVLRGNTRIPKSP